MIEYTTGDIFESPARALVCPVNCVGAMGRGLALEFAGRFRGLKADHGHLCRAGGLKPGLCSCWFNVDGGPHVVLFPTKDDWRRPSRPSLIYAGLGSMVLLLESLPTLGSVAIPPLGCGLGGLGWGRVWPMIRAACELLPDRHFSIYAPPGA